MTVPGLSAYVARGVPVGDRPAVTCILQCALPLLVLLGWHTCAVAQEGQTPSLVQLVSTYTAQGIYPFNGLALAAASANDGAYAKLLPLCAPPPTSAPQPGACAGATLQLYNQLRALEDNANQLLRQGEQLYSLRLSASGLAAALQMTAPEEYAAQGSLTTQFANSQAKILTSRFSVLHFAALASKFAGNVDDPSSATWGAAYAALGGSAGGDSTVSFGRLSAFVNSGFESGQKDPTVFEDAFDFNSTEVSAGLDYRLSDRLVVGLLAGHSERRLNFNSAESVASGGVRGNGQSATLYVQYEADAAYVNGSVGTQHMSLRTQRLISYPSNNPLVPAVDETASSDAGANTTTVSLAGGYVWHYRAASLEPYFNGLYTHTRIGAFRESSADGFAVSVEEQGIVSAEAALGLKLQYALLPRFGVIVPYVYGEYRHQFAESSRNIASSYAADGNSSSDFNIPTDAATNHYYVVGAGGSIVLPHGLQAFLQYTQVLEYTNYTDHVFSGGIRWEFR